MGDYTNVSIYIDKKDYAHLKDATFEADMITEIAEGVIKFHSYEVNYARWDELEDVLKSKCIPYDKVWGAGDNYEEGEGYYRIIEGEYVGYDIGDYDRARVTVMDEVLSWDKSLEKLKEHLTKIRTSILPFECKSLFDYDQYHYISATRFKFSELYEEAKCIAIKRRMYRHVDGQLQCVDEGEARLECENDVTTEYTIGGDIIND